ncbi:MAG TPA: ester cyclase [Anaerolineae bacterium]|nr:ester cyclase [Anaerolineae bacterium]
MSPEQNKITANRIPLEVFNKKNQAVLDQVVWPDAVDHVVPPGMPPTVASTRQFISMLLAAFPDFQYTIDFAIAEGDKVVQRVTASGTMQGDFMGMKASGKHATWTETHIVRLVDGKVAEHWGNLDQVGMLQQLGLMPGA